MNTSITELKIVPHEEIEKRIEQVKPLQEDENEMYAVVKDATTGEHFVRYTQRHIHLMEGGVEEVFDHFLPVDNDDVLAIILGEKEYAYPDNWKHTYLRGSNMDPYVWFDPAAVEEEEEDDEKRQAFLSLVSNFKKEQKFDDETIRNLLKKIDEVWEERR
ncbi:hypothetical protein [Aneurinibacillus terranovensis]|uniref:hypothetical protein n=1 Tax=Aneurinibacillus terranovensis TaxID=278991 RepID=UPI0012DF41E4|nr:hypothetical protein [Aneurinibacillus terranovensis]